MREICLIRRIFDRRGGINICSIRSFSRLYESPISTPIIVSSPPNSSIPLKSSFCDVSSIPATTRLHLSNPSLQFQRTLCSSPGSSNIILIKSEEEFNGSMKNIQEKSLPAIFYFTAAWCGPCKFISPILAELSEKYPHVTTYKIDIDQDGLGSLLSRLYITAVPTLHFFENGKNAAEIVGADVGRLKDTMEELYGKD
ncbi:hypothetical protein P3X46_007142 [Hevea brasiliensis]|uniref:Thioredoxin domain-containing protein n=1 Tax=Hevea brasiliensis TaxID=3981 RepID=A0ABQ9MW97_HEVBR|nr:thioredoxin O2, mitochondrial isoform X1 [Hevea brasiliensis]KAJ9183263.1 hypothetical protein P3X46_007142 [Hevea brasiliensis]